MSKRNAHDFRCAQDVHRINRDAHSEYNPEDDREPAFDLGGRSEVNEKRRAVQALRESLGLR